MSKVEAGDGPHPLQLYPFEPTNRHPQRQQKASALECVHAASESDVSADRQWPQSLKRRCRPRHSVSLGRHRRSYSSAVMSPTLYVTSRMHVVALLALWLTCASWSPPHLAPTPELPVTVQFAMYPCTRCLLSGLLTPWLCDRSASALQKKYLGQTRKISPQPKN